MSSNRVQRLRSHRGFVLAVIISICALIGLVLANFPASSFSASLFGQGGAGKDTNKNLNSGNLQNKGKKPVNVVATTPILADLARAVAGQGAQVVSLVPPGSDPHSFEPSLAQIRSIAYADVAFTNHLLLEESALIRAVESNLPSKSRLVPVAETAARYGIKYLPLVEDATLSTIWLGARIVDEDAKNQQQMAQTQDREQQYNSGSKTASLEAVGYRFWPAVNNNHDDNQYRSLNFEKTGHLTAFLTGTFGQLEPYFSTRDGLCTRAQCGDDRLILPAGAHTHLSWAFSAPGWYQLDLRGRLQDNTLTEVFPLTFAVGVAPTKPPSTPPSAQTTTKAATGSSNTQKESKIRVLGEGHVDVTLDVKAAKGTDNGKTDADTKAALYLQADAPDSSGEPLHIPMDTAVIEVPNISATTVPSDPAYRFLAKPGSGIYVLAQAVLGKHVHGEIDPHMWLSVPNAMAYVKVMKDALAKADPSRADYFSQRADQYLARLGSLHEWMQETLGSIPKAQRRLVTTHDAYGYLAKTYGLSVSGFVSANPGVEPSAQDIVKLSNTIDLEKVPALFIEPFAISGTTQLRQIASQHGVRVCQLWSDTFSKPGASGQKVGSYEELMYTNAYNLKVCLDPDSAIPQPWEGLRKPLDRGKTEKG